MTVEPGAELLHYTLSEQIGEGGMGAVWRATDTTLNRDVAIKILPRAVAEDQDHHPDILLSWGKAVVTIWTHKIDGLTESDFVFAAKTDAVR